MTSTLTLKTGDSVTVIKNGHIHVTAEDNGGGMKKEQLSRLFRDGIQFNENELQNGQGSGLGLFISKGIMVMVQHSGTLTAKSEGLGKGAAFTVTLPLYVVQLRNGEHRGKPISRIHSSSRRKRKRNGKFRHARLDCE